MKYLFIGLIAVANLSGIYTPEERVYVDEYQIGDDAFYVHIGENNWVSTKHLTCDGSGVYTLSRNLHSKSIEKKWKCPYCFRFWPIGQACQNPDCPSKYR